MTGIPASVNARAVPPVLRISILRATRARANSTSPVLSETDSRALRMVTSIAAGSAGEPELAQFFAQRAPVDAENRGGAALVAGRIIEHRAEQGFFDFAQHHVVQVRRLVAVQVGEIVGQCALGVVAQRHFERAVATGIFSGP